MQQIKASFLTKETQAAIRKELAAQTVIQWPQLYNGDVPNNDYIQEVLSGLAKQYLGINTTFEYYGRSTGEAFPKGFLSTLHGPPDVYKSSYAQNKDTVGDFPGLLKQVSLDGTAEYGNFAMRLMLYWIYRVGNKEFDRVTLLSLYYDKKTGKVRELNKINSD